MQMMTIKAMSVLVFVVLIIVTLKAPPISCLRCFECASRDNPGCIKLDDRVVLQPCNKGEVCVKTVALMEQEGAVFTQGVIRACVPYSPALGPNNQCIPITGSGHLSIRCLCDDRDDCNKTGGLHLNFKSHLVFMLASCLSTIIIRNLLFVLR